MWNCEDCGWEGGWPKWDQKEAPDELDSFVEIPYCPKCGSYNVVDDPTADYAVKPEG